MQESKIGQGTTEEHQTHCSYEHRAVHRGSMHDGRGGENVEKCMVKLADIGSQYTFVMTIRRCSAILNWIMAALNYEHITFGA